MMEAVEAILDMALLTVASDAMLNTFWLHHTGRDWQFCGWLALINIALYAT